jgi:hypothetical protein
LKRYQKFGEYPTWGGFKNTVCTIILDQGVLSKKIC